LPDTKGRLLTKTYYAPLLSGVWFQARISNTTGDNMNLHSVGMRFTYAGSERHELGTPP
jgi:hypothetical protein